MTRALLALVLVLGSADAARGAELAYNWKKGATYRFEAQSKDEMSMAAMGIDLRFSFVTRSRFSLAIDKVSPGGTAQGKLVMEGFEVKTADGRPVAGLETIPADALVSLVEIDRKGHFTLKQRVWIVVDDNGQNQLVSASASPTGVSGAATANGEQVTLYANFDPKTGKLAAGYDVKQIAKKTRKISILADKPRVDVLPTQFLALLALPGGDLSAGGSADLKLNRPGISSDTKVSLEMLELTAEKARLKTTIATASKANTTAAAAGASDGPGEGGMPDLATAMGGMGAMPGMPGKAGPGGGGGAPPVTMGLTMDGEFVTDFDVKAGMLKALEGTLTVDSGAAGMSMKNHSELQMKRL